MSSNPQANFTDTYLSMTDRGSVNPSTRRIGLRFNVSRDDIRGGVRPTQTGLTMELYNKWQDVNNPRLLGSFPLEVFNIINSVPEAWIIIPISQINLLNEADLFLVKQGSSDLHTIEINDFNIILQTGVSTFSTMTPDQLFQQLVLSSIISQNMLDIVTTNFTFQFNSSFITPYIDSITNVDFISAPVYPITTEPRSNITTYSGNLIPETIPTFTAYLGRVGNQFPKREYNFSVQNTVPELPDVEIPSTPNSVLSLDTFDVESGGFLQARWNLNPDIPESQIRELVTNQQTVLPTVGSIEQRVYGFGLINPVTFQSVEDGESYRVFVTITLQDGTRIVSPEYNFEYRGGDIVPDTRQFAEFTIEQTKIFMNGLGQESVQYILSNQLFNSVDVSQVRIEMRGAGEPQEVVVINGGLSSQIPIRIPNLLEDTIYEVAFYATYLDKEILITTLRLQTLAFPPAQPTPEDTVKIIEDSVIRQNYSYEDSVLIEALNDREREQIVCGIVLQKNMPESDQFVHDFNDKNRKGSIYNRGESDAVRTRYTESLESRLQMAVEVVPDIDEGYNQ